MDLPMLGDRIVREATGDEFVLTDVVSPPPDHRTVYHYRSEDGSVTGTLGTADFLPCGDAGAAFAILKPLNARSEPQAATRRLGDSDAAA